MRKLLFLLPLLFSQYTYAVVCPAGEVESGGVCVSACSILQGETRTYTYDSYIWGDSPTSFCFGSYSGGAACRMSASGSVVLNVPAGSQYFSRSFKFTGVGCAFDQINRFSGDSPEPFPFENDVNQNGVDDDEEDWDGDGIKNGVDPDPYSNDNEIADADGNGVPDNLDPFYDSLVDSTDVGDCSNYDEDCGAYRHVMNKLNNNNAQLGNIIRQLSQQNLTKDAFNVAVAELIKSQESNDYSFLNKLDSLTGAQSSLEDTVRESVWASRQDIKNRLDDRYNQTFNKLNDMEDLINGGGGFTDQFLQEIKAVASDTNSGVKALPVQLNALHQHMDQNKDQLITAINNSGGSGDSGLTTTQKNQLKNAAKANANNKILNRVEGTVNRIDGNFDDVSDSLRGLDTSVNGLTPIIFDMKRTVEQNQSALSTLSSDINVNTDAKFNLLSDQIAAISSGDSTVDLTGVESSIDALSDKIDGLEIGESDTKPSGVCQTNFVCTGNDYECFLAKQAFETKCALSFNAIGDALSDSLGTEHGSDVLIEANENLQGALDGLNQGLEDVAIKGGDGTALYLEEQDITQYLDAYNQENGGIDFGNNECPRPIELNFMLAGVQQVNLELSLEWLCELALYVRAMLMLGAAMISGRLWFQNF